MSQSETIISIKSVGKIYLCFELKCMFKLLYSVVRDPLKNSNCFLFRHRACNIFARTYHEAWLQEENVGQEIMIEDLTVSVKHEAFIHILLILQCFLAII